MLNGDPETTAMRVARPMSPTDVARSASRRLSCQVGSGDESSCPCLCPGYDPVLVVPLSLVDKIELNNDVRPTANRLVSEANIGASLRRAGLERNDLILEAFEKQFRGLPPSHRIRFRVRNEKRLWLMESAGIYLAHSVEQQLEKSEFELNQKMLPDLKKWVERYRSVKLTRCGEAARKFAEDANHDADMLKASMQDSSGTGDASGAFGWRDPETAAAKAILSGPARPVILCRCGHAEVWHEKPLESNRPGSSPHDVAVASRASTPKASAAALAAPPRTAPPLALRPPGPESLTRTLPPQGPLFPMVADKGRPRPPSRSRSEPSVSGGRLLLRKAGAASLRSNGGGDAAAAAAAGPRVTDTDAAALVSPGPADRPKQKRAKERRPGAARPNG